MIYDRVNNPEVTCLGDLLLAVLSWLWLYFRHFMARTLLCVMLFLVASSGGRLVCFIFSLTFGFHLIHVTFPFVSFIFFSFFLLIFSLYVCSFLSYMPVSFFIFLCLSFHVWFFFASFIFLINYLFPSLSLSAYFYLYR